MRFARISRRSAAIVRRAAHDQRRARGRQDRRFCGKPSVIARELDERWVAEVTAPAVHDRPPLAQRVEHGSHKAGTRFPSARATMRITA
jgi:hypothetical protein